MTKPTIHLNGTSREALLDGYIEAGNKLANAIRALEEAAPNGRDYYPQGPEALAVAQREHQSRVERLQSVHNELSALIEAVAC